MLIVLSPAKSLDYESPAATTKASEPTMLEHTEELVGVMAGKSPRQLSNLMGISPQLAELNFERFQNWEHPYPEGAARQAVLAFRGDVYLGLDAGSFDQRDFTHAQKTLRILSGLYGVLRPLDLIQPYRLEMGSRVETSAGPDLYSFWGCTITETLNQAIEDSPGVRALVNLASNEYFSSVKPELLVAPVITPSFLDEKDGLYKTISFFAKKARGSMAAWIIRNRVKTLKGLQGFDGLGYRYDPERSRRDSPVFTRPER